MYEGKKVIVVMPAYKAALTLEKTYHEIPHDWVDEVILVDDHSPDNTVEVAKQVGIKHVIRHDKNLGYGGNQKTCYTKALELGGDIVIMLHPDYQYTPMLLKAMISIIGNGLYPVVFASRILGKGALKGGMPIYKYIANRLLTLFQNILIDQKLSEYHTGYRAFSKEALQAVNFTACDDDFIFDNQMVLQLFWKGFEVGEVTCPTKYFEEASSINFKAGILVSEKQRGNPLLRLLRLIPWAFSADIVPDYVMGSTTCAIFLSIKYHLLHPKYVERRITELGRTFRLRILLVYVDDLNSTKALFDLNKICFMSDVTLVLAWSNEECARYLETFKNYEDKPSTSIQVSN
jgi:DNA repair protein Rad10